VAWPKEGPTQLWKRKAGQGFSAPVVAGNKIVLFHREQDSEKVECLNATNGESLWAFAYPSHYEDHYVSDSGPRATPAISQDKVYTFGAEGKLHCLDLQTGKTVWHVDTKAEFGAGSGFFGIACSPLIEGDLVLLNIGGKNSSGSTIGIIALQKQTGKVAWTASEDEASYSSPVAATIRGERYAFFFTRKYLTAVAPTTGKIFFDFLWQPKIHASVSAATPLVIGDSIFISASYGAGAALLRVGESGPEKVWAGEDILSNHYATSVHHAGYLYGFHGRQEQGCDLRCVEVQTGKVKWSRDHFGAGTLLLAGTSLLLLTEKGELIMAPAKPDEFKPVARAQVLPFEARAYPALAHGRFYGRGKDTLVCVDLREDP
jgi:outer membrane protein assembly factor BamB